MLMTSRSGHRSNPDVLQEDIISIKNWSTSWSLHINDAKCAHMSLEGASGNRFIIHDGAAANDIPTLDLKKDLGVWITSSLFFTHHHALAAKKGFTVLNMIRRTFPRINRDDFQQLYATYVRPLLEYASSVVHSGLQMDINCWREYNAQLLDLSVACNSILMRKRMLPPQHLSSWHSSSAWWLDSYFSSLRRESSR